MSVCDAYDSSTETSVGYDLTTPDGYALLLPGNMSIDADVNDGTYFNDGADIASNDTARFFDVKLLDPLYYIKASYDINSKITMMAGNDNGNTGIDGVNDDAWKLDGFSVSKASASDVSYKLRTGTADNVNGAIITASDKDGAAGTFNLTFTVSADDQGAISTSNKVWSGIDVSGVVAEDITQAQNAHWVDSDGAGITGAAALKENDVDRLRATLTKDDVNDHWITETNTLLASFNQSAVTDWTITVNDVLPDPQSNLSAYAQNRFQGDSTLSANNDVFGENDQIVLSDGFTYGLNFDDNLGNNHVLVADTKVYGVLFQKSA
jgi:hypothetical protein